MKTSKSPDKSQKSFGFTFAEYQKAAIVTKKKWDTKEGDIADCGLGIAGEAGEVADILKKHLSGSKVLDTANTEKLKLELGDVMWYIASLCDCMGFDLGEIAGMNIDKLHKRHGDTYSGFGKREI